MGYGVALVFQNQPMGGNHENRGLVNGDRVIGEQTIATRALKYLEIYSATLVRLACAIAPLSQHLGYQDVVKTVEQHCQITLSNRDP